MAGKLVRSKEVARFRIRSKVVARFRVRGKVVAGVEAVKGVQMVIRAEVFLCIRNVVYVRGFFYTNTVPHKGQAEEPKQIHMVTVEMLVGSFRMRGVEVVEVKDQELHKNRRLAKMEDLVGTKTEVGLRVRHPIQCSDEVPDNYPGLRRAEKKTFLMITKLRTKFVYRMDLMS